MPKLKSEYKLDKFSRLLKGYGLNGNKLGSIIRVSRSTGLRRSKDPGSITINELFAIVKKTPITWSEIFEALSYGDV